MASPMDASLLNFSSACRSAFISLACCSRRSISVSGADLKNWDARFSSPRLRRMSSMVTFPVVASMRRTPEATLLSLLIRNGPTLAVLSRWVPPHSSMEKSPMVTTRTV